MQEELLIPRALNLLLNLPSIIDGKLWPNLGPVCCYTARIEPGSKSTVQYGWWMDYEALFNQLSSLLKCRPLVSRWSFIYVRRLPYSASFYDVLIIHTYTSDSVNSMLNGSCLNRFDKFVSLLSYFSYYYFLGRSLSAPVVDRSVSSGFCIFVARMVLRRVFAVVFACFWDTRTRHLYYNKRPIPLRLMLVILGFSLRGVLSVWVRTCRSDILTPWKSIWGFLQSFVS